MPMEPTGKVCAQRTSCRQNFSITSSNKTHKWKEYFNASVFLQVRQIWQNELKVQLCSGYVVACFWGVACPDFCVEGPVFGYSILSFTAPIILSLTVFLQPISNISHVNLTCTCGYHKSICRLNICLYENSIL